MSLCAQRRNESRDSSDTLLLEDAPGLAAEDGDVGLAGEELDVFARLEAEADGEREVRRAPAALEVGRELVGELGLAAGDALARDDVDEASAQLPQGAHALVRRARREDED